MNTSVGSLGSSRTDSEEINGKATTSFGIDDILGNSFGTAQKQIYEDLSDDNEKDEQKTGSSSTEDGNNDANMVWPAWVYCTRYSDRPSAGPRAKRTRKKEGLKRPRTAFSNEQLSSLQSEFEKHQYLTEERRLTLSNELNLSVSQIKVWFQNKRAKIKKISGVRNTLASQLMAQGLYNHCSSNSS